MSDSDQAESKVEISDGAKLAKDLGIFGTVNLLFGPSARILGEHWANRLQTKLTAKQTENLETMVATAEQKTSIDQNSDISPRQVGALIEWTHHAKNVDIETSPTLSQAWSGALSDIAKENYTLLDALHGLSEPEVSDFVLGGEISNQLMEKFASLGFMDVKVELVSPLWLRILGNENIPLVYASVANAALLISFLAAALVAPHIFDDISMGRIFLPFYLCVFLYVSGLPRWFIRQTGLFSKYGILRSKGRLTDKGAALRDRLGFDEKRSTEYWV